MSPLIKKIIHILLSLALLAGVGIVVWIYVFKPIVLSFKKGMECWDTEYICDEWTECKDNRQTRKCTVKASLEKSSPNCLQIKQPTLERECTENTTFNKNIILQCPNRPEKEIRDILSF